MYVCFTGTAFIDGVPANRELLEKTAILAGLKPLKSATKKCDVLTTLPIRSRNQAKPAQLAMRGIPIISIKDFIDAT